MSRAARQRSKRSDALANRARVLDAAVAAVRQKGEKVPMAVIAANAGVGVGTLYRHFPTRGELLAALTQRSFELVADNARAAAAHHDSAVDSLRMFLERALEYRDQLVLPLHGGPARLDDDSSTLQAEIREHIAAILARGRANGTVSEGVTARDVIIAGAQLASPLPHVDDWDAVARRQMHVFVAGLAAVEL